MIEYAVMNPEQYAANRKSIRGVILMSSDQSEFLVRMCKGDSFPGCEILSEGEAAKHRASWDSDTGKHAGDEPADYSAMSKKELLAAAEDQGVELPEGKIKKAELVSLLEGK